MCAGRVPRPCTGPTAHIHRTALARALRPDTVVFNGERLVDRSPQYALLRGQSFATRFPDRPRAVPGREYLGVGKRILGGSGPRAVRFGVAGRERSEVPRNACDPPHRTGCAL